MEINPQEGAMLGNYVMLSGLLKATISTDIQRLGTKGCSSRIPQTKSCVVMS